MKWDSQLYDKQHGFVSGYGSSLLDLIDTSQHPIIWDLGCGTGTLSAKLTEKGAKVIGTDISESMILLAKQNYPHIDFRVANALDCTFEEPFDIVFSNAVFHWILDQQHLLANIKQSLRPQGRLICEMGGKNNIAAIEQAFEIALSNHGVAYKNQFFFPDKDEYKSLLELTGFEVQAIDAFSRPTELPNGEEGMKLWLAQFFDTQLSPLSPETRHAVIDEAESLLRPRLWQKDRWVADYHRLRFIAVNP